MKTTLPFVEGLSKILQKNGAITEKMARKLSQDFKGGAKENFDDFLLSEGLVSREDLLKALEEYFELPAFDAKGCFFDHDLVRKFPKEVMFSKGFIPLERDGNILVVLASDPLDDDLSEIIGDYVSYVPEFRVGIKQDIMDAVIEYFDTADTVVSDDALDEFGIDDSELDSIDNYSEEDDFD
ncbi:MAG: Type II secretion system protein E (GspE) [candidate division TM6 bacterium GW2011_GWF2_32_72]|nr:MAG: Type II secretion system protein E (GspE) [candidate division TM6 bacterium GW2011_GWF2_32_72]